MRENKIGMGEFERLGIAVENCKNEILKAMKIDMLVNWLNKLLNKK